MDTATSPREEDQATNADAGSSNNSLRPPGHYAKANTTSVLPEFSNSEQDFIRSAFSPGNAVRIHQLPDKLRHNRITKNRSLDRLGNLGPTKAASVTANTNTETQATRCLLPEGTSKLSLPPPSPINFKSGGPPAFNIPQESAPPLSNRSFGEFAYHESPYDAIDREQRKDRKKVIDICFLHDLKLYSDPTLNLLSWHAVIVKTQSQVVSKLRHVMTSQNETCNDITK